MRYRTPDCASSVSLPKRNVRLAARSSHKTLFWSAVIIVAVVALDQWTKHWAISHLAGQPSLQVLGDFLQLTLVYNEGGAMGTRLGSSAYYLFMALIVLPFLLFYIYRHRNRLSISLALSFIAAGAVGNLIDRIRFGKVIDFVDFDFFDINLWGYRLERFWVFNVADSAITCAIVFLLFYIIFKRHSYDQIPPDEPIEPQPESE